MVVIILIYSINGIHYSKTINFWYHNWISNKEKVLKKYGESCYREYLIFLGWSTEIARQGSSTAYQIVCHKNINTMDRTRYIGKVNLGDNEKAVYNKTIEFAQKKNLTRNWENKIFTDIYK